MKIKILAIMSAGFLLASCAKEEEGGSLRLELKVDAVVAEQVTRSFVIEGAPAAGEFSLHIRKSDGSYENRWDKLTDYEDGFRLKAGTYRATASYGDPAEEGFGKPAFRAETDFDILDEAVTPAEMTAKLVNMAASIRYDDIFKEYFPTYYSVITTSAGIPIDFSENPGGVAFMDAKTFDVTVHYTRQNGNPGSAVFTVKDGIAPCKHFNITVGVNDGQIGNAAITVSFDGTTQSVPIEIDLGKDE